MYIRRDRVASKHTLDKIDLIKWCQYYPFHTNKTSLQVCQVIMFLQKPGINWACTFDLAVFKFYDNRKCCFRNINACWQSLGSISSGSGSNCLHSARNEGSRKSSSTVRTPECSAASCSCSSETGKPVCGNSIMWIHDCYIKIMWPFLSIQVHILSQTALKRFDLNLWWLTHKWGSLGHFFTTFFFCLYGLCQAILITRGGGGGELLRIDYWACG